MKHQRPTSGGLEILSPSEFKEKMNIEISTNTLSYQFKNETLDYCEIGGSRFVIWNDKAKTFSLTNRGRKRG